MGQSLFVVAAVGSATLAALLLRAQLAPTNLAMLYLLAVVTVAARCDRATTVVASFLSVATFDFFCIPPYYTLRIDDYEYAVTFVVMLGVALLISTQTARLRMMASDADARAARTEALYRLTQGLAGETRVFDMARTAAELAREVFGVEVIIFLPQSGRISFERRTSKALPVPASEQEIAQWVFECSVRAGAGTGHRGDAHALYLPLRGGSAAAGVMAVVARDAGRTWSTEQQHLLEVFAHQTALAIERTLSERAAEDSRIRMQSEQMRSSLLSGVSHDLRTPLATITGAASTLRLQGERLDAATRGELLDSISDEAERLGRLVANLLDMTRLETGVELRREWYPMEEIVGAVLQRLDVRLAGREVRVEIPELVPMVLADDVLLGQLLTNLLENALKYTPPGSPVEIVASADPQWVVVEVRDRGPGIAEGEEERIFEKFYRGGRVNGSAAGAGLGLPICRAIAQAHGGDTVVLAREGGGAVFRIRLPRRSEP